MKLSVIPFLVDLREVKPTHQPTLHFKTDKQQTTIVFSDINVFFILKCLFSDKSKINGHVYLFKLGLVNYLKTCIVVKTHRTSFYMDTPFVCLLLYLKLPLLAFVALPVEIHWI